MKPPISCATQYGITAAIGNLRPTASPNVTAGLKWPPEIWPKAAIIRPSPRPKPAATPADAIEPGRLTDAAMPLKPMKKNPNVPTTSARSRLLIAGASTVSSAGRCRVTRSARER